MPQPDPILAEIVAQLQAQLAERDQRIAGQRALLSRKDQVLALPRSRSRTGRAAAPGPYRPVRQAQRDAERFATATVGSGAGRFERGGCGRERTEPLKPPPQDNTSGKPQRKHPGRQELPSHLERVEQVVACTPEQCDCGKCGKQTTVIGYEETEVLDVRPAVYFVRVIKREKRACRSCEKQGVQTATVPERIDPSRYCLTR